MKDSISENGILHATAVELHEQGILIFGPSGSGKSSLAIELISLGASLIADDKVHVNAINNELWMHRPTTLPRAIEARGVGLIPVPLTAGTRRVNLVVDMAKDTTNRLGGQTTSIGGINLPCIFGRKNAVLAQKLLLFCKHGTTLID